MRFMLFPFFAVALLAEQPSGVPARSSASSYPGHASAAALALGAELLSADEVRNSFATDLNRGFLVIEAGIFPAAGKGWDVRLSDFSLRIGADKYVRPVAASTIASILQSKALGKHKQQAPGSPSDIVIYPSTTIGYETGGGGLDPYGRQRRGGWTTGAGVGVGVGGGGQQQGPPLPPPTGASDADRSTMSQELRDKALPDGETLRAVAGYLYFPMPDAKKGGGPDPKKAYELIYQSGDVKIRTAMPAPK